MIDGVNISYDKLWKKLYKKNMIKKTLREQSGVTTTVIAKLGKNETVHLEALIKICKVLNCNIDDIMEISFSD